MLFVVKLEMLSNKQKFVLKLEKDNDSVSLMKKKREGGFLSTNFFIILVVTVFFIIFTV